MKYRGVLEKSGSFWRAACKHRCFWGWLPRVRRSDGNPI